MSTPETYPDKNALQRFKRQILKIVDPMWYTSRTGRKYAYFGDDELKVIVHRMANESKHDVNDM